MNVPDMGEMPGPDVDPIVDPYLPFCNCAPAFELLSIFIIGYLGVSKMQGSDGRALGAAVRVQEVS